MKAIILSLAIFASILISNKVNAQTCGKWADVEANLITGHTGYSVNVWAKDPKPNKKFQKPKYNIHYLSARQIRTWRKYHEMYMAGNNSPNHGRNKKVKKIYQSEIIFTAKN